MISSSQLTTFKSCPMKYKYKYISRIKKIDEEERDALKLGLYFHELLENDLDVDSSNIPLSEKDKMAVEASADYYYHNYLKKDKETEEINEFKIQGEYCIEHLSTECECDNRLDVIGFIDKVILDDEEGDTLIDYKYVTSTEMSETYAFSDQAKFYPLFYTLQTGRKIKEFKFVCITKPTIRIKKTETKKDYFNRMKEWYTPEKIKEVQVLNHDLQQKEIITELFFMDHMIDNNVFFRNYSSCKSYGSQCDYYEICQNHEKLDNFEHLYKVSTRKG